jgi:hypothetical protein
MGNRPNKELWHTAVHEAGHAVAAYLTGTKIKVVTIKPDEKTLGYVRHAAIRHGVSETQRPLTDRFVNQAVVSFGGAVACMVMHLRDATSGDDNDSKAVENLCEAIALSPDETRHIVTWLKVRTIGLLSVPPAKSAIRALATALVERTTLNGIEATSIISRATRA